MFFNRKTLRCPLCEKSFNKLAPHLIEDHLISKSDAKNIEVLASSSSLSTEIKNCTFQYQCPKEWHELDPTPYAGIKFCDTCNENVYLAKNQSQVNWLAENSICTAVIDVSHSFLVGRQKSTSSRKVNRLSDEELEKFDITSFLKRMAE